MSRLPGDSTRLDHDRLGAYPRSAVEALADLGLSDDEIARYFRVERSRIARLREGRPRIDCGAAALALRPTTPAHPG
ncbi:hypothetical protein SAMN04490244_101601 [Tranquillimonas rosea]|uniref:Uncharacterized protein n=1 Tax=Tranquillimonas rosea TaxID=641238 RepID=A0A1H9QEJ5_9RHOB|nr:hypothetical protein [Tranquillimonas rosea]SER58966.1 hypothetical protein SAMN04490244_101601 [Tranquillimonas rosea]